MGEGLGPAACVGNRTRFRAGSAGAGIPRDVCWWPPVWVIEPVPGCGGGVGRGCGMWDSKGVVGSGSFCCSGQHQETRQAKDHPKAAYEAWHTAWRYPFRARRDWQSQAHLHTTLNKSRDEKLEIGGVWPTYHFGKRACIMGES